MSNFSYVLPSGVWPSGHIVLHGELQQLDQNLFKTANFVDGSTHAPSSVITVGGAGMTLALVGSNTVSSGSLQFDSSASLGISAGGQFVCQGDALFYATVDVLSGTWDFSAGTHTTFDAGSFLTVAGSAHFTGALVAVGVGVQDLQASGNVDTQTFNVHGAAQFDGDATFDGAVGHNGTTFLQGPTFAQATTISGTLTAEGAASFAQPISCTGAARVVKRTTYISSGGTNATFSVSSTDRVVVGGLTGNVTYTLDHNAVEGDEILIVNRSSTFVVNVNDIANGNITQLTFAGRFAVMCLFRSGAWEGLWTSHV